MSSGTPHHFDLTLTEKVLETSVDLSVFADTARCFGPLDLISVASGNNWLEVLNNA